MGKNIQISTQSLLERAKELECLYMVEEALKEASVPDNLAKIISIIPKGFRETSKSSAVIELYETTYGDIPSTTDRDELSVVIKSEDTIHGHIRVFYPKGLFAEDEGVFLDQEVRLLDTIANRIAEMIDKQDFGQATKNRSKWKAILRLLQKTDQSTLTYACEKMFGLLEIMNPDLLKQLVEQNNWEIFTTSTEINFPQEALPDVDIIYLSDILFMNARNSFSDLQIYEYLSSWIYQGKTYDLVKNVTKVTADKNKLSQALKAYINAVKDSDYQSFTTKRWLLAELTRRFITDNPKTITKIHKYFDVETFVKLLDSYISSPRRIGRIGGKASGLLVAYKIIESKKHLYPELESIVIPKTWFISADEFRYILDDNNLDELYEHKYKEIMDIRMQYPRIVQRIKKANLSPYIINELSNLLEECKDCPLIIRSSSVLEDQIDTAFSGKYKSLFIANIGTKEERLHELTDGILEVYASIFNPNVIEYRKERDLLDCDENMGIIIQEVVGNRVGKYYFPLYAGVAFSNNEFRWSQRIRREDGLLRMVMGLGTRAVDRVGDDYPILFSPGQPKLRVNHTIDEHQRLSPQYIDLIDLEENKFITMSINDLIKVNGSKIPAIDLIASEIKDDILMNVNSMFSDFKRGNIVISFNKLVSKTSFLKQMKTMLTILQDELGYPVDIEFASDGNKVYILQCRPQSRSYDNRQVAIPSDISAKRMVFTANKFVSTGKVSGIRTIVYVDPYEYSNLRHKSDMVKIATIVSELNQILGHKSFILMGPGRWGSRGDIRLGVPVAYSDINNTAMLIEVASKQSKYNPELSFGTHFFQDLVEANIKYLPLYPEDEDVIFNKEFFASKNALEDLLPSYGKFSDVVKVVRVENMFPGSEMLILMNGDLQKAVAYIDSPQVDDEDLVDETEIASMKSGDSEGWRWRHYIAEQIANKLDLEAYGVMGIYLIGSSSKKASKSNDVVDLIVHFAGNDKQKEKLKVWLEGWSFALAELNYLKTGSKMDGLLDVHYITDEDIEKNTFYAEKIYSVYEPALPLKVRGVKVKRRRK